MRVRVRYSKFGKVRFLSHRDLARIIERAVRRADLPVSYSEGFSPHARLHFGLALSTGYESHAEYFDVDLDEDRDGMRPAPELAAALDPCLPAGVTTTASRELEPGTPSLQDAVTSSTWRFDLPAADADEVVARAAQLLAADELPLELVRKGKQVREDLRPLLLDLVAERTPAGALLTAELGTKPRSVRPAELLAALRLDVEPTRVVRMHQWITSDGERREPIELAAPSPHAQARAS
jgi:radical SAM-linked protein